MKNTAFAYFDRFECRPPLITTSPPDDLTMVIVIPCHDEPDLLTTLRSLDACDLPQNPVEVIVVVNESDNASVGTSQQNKRTVEEVCTLTKQRSESTLTFHIVSVTDLPIKHAGVGLARKIGMDEALRRLATIDSDGWIVCLDADCEVANNYLVMLEDSFLKQTPNSATIYFEHQLSSVTTPELREGIIYYELFLRYYVNALRYAGFPYAMHTVGSSMAVRATLYARTGGMNRRKAGEDFYFLHKMAPHGRVREITGTAVYPSARVSQRVPFGTGRAQAEWLQGGRRHTYHPATFEDLKTLFSFAAEQYTITEEEIGRRTEQLPEVLQQFLQKNAYLERVSNLKASTTHPVAFRRRFFAWFDGFMVLKYVHYARDHGRELVPLPAAAQALLRKIGHPTVPSEEEALLRIYRALDRSVE